jgi:hypothetical protein
VFSFWFRLPFRVRLGVVAVVILVVAVVLGCIAIGDPVHHPIRRYGGVIKFAPILFLAWLAWRDFVRIPLWVYIVSFPVLIVCMIKPLLFFFVIPIVFFVLYCKPVWR